MKKILLASVLTFCFIFTTNISYADFFVIAAGKKAKRTVLVSPKNLAPDYSDNGTVLLTAFDKITDASADNPYLVILEPAIYNIGSSALQIKPYVDIQGSGENVTKITGAIDEQYSGVVCGADNSEIRFITVENTGGGTYSNGIYNENCSLSIFNVTASASGGAINNAIYNNTNACTTMINVTANASNGYNTNRGIYCSDSKDIMTNVKAKGSGGDYSFGILINNSAAEITMTNVTAEAIFGSIKSRGVCCWESSTSMNNLKVTAAGGNDAQGIFNYNASIRIVNSNVRASSGTTNYGVYSNTNSNVNIDHSIIVGSTASVYTSENSTTRIGNSRLEGGFIINEGDCKCAGVYDENYTFYTSTCP